MTFDLLLDAGVVHDLGGIESVGEKVAPLLLGFTQSLAQV